MRTFINLIAFLTLSAALCACGGKSDPKAMAVEFAEAFVNGDFEKCNSMLTDTCPDDMKTEKEMSALEKALLTHIRENTEKMKYRFTVDEEESQVGETFSSYFMTVTSETDPEFRKTINVDLKKDSDTGKWGVEMYSKGLNRLIGF